jgi:branched-chain amino acid transport system substrate-binding protein
MGARPLMTQVLDGDIKVIFPTDYREATPLFPMKG